MVPTAAKLIGRVVRECRSWLFFTCALWLLLTGSLWAGNFYAGTTPADVPWPSGVVPYEFTNALTPAEQKTFFDGIREWELAANVQFVPHTNQTRWVLFTYNTNYLDNVSVGYNPQVVTVSSLSRGQVCHEMGHSFGFTHENIRIDRTNYLTVLTNNISPPANLVFFEIDPTSVTNGPYDFQSVMHLANNFSSVDPASLFTQVALPAYTEYQPRMGNNCLSPGDRAALSYLYGPPAVPLTSVVTTTADFGPGSLRAALYYVTDHPATSVTFNIPTTDPGYSDGVFTIYLTGYLPPLVTDGMVIDGSTQPGFSGKPLIVVDGSQLIPEAYPPDFVQVTGLQIYSANCHVKNLSFQNFDWNGITLSYPYATNNTVSGCWLGPDFTGTNAAPNALQGVLIYLGASRNLIGGTNALQRNVLSGDSQYGVLISGTNTTGNIVEGNYIGTDASGTLMVSNAFGGVFLADGATQNLIGGTNIGAGNLISGNLGNGILMDGSAVVNNTVQGNFIGTDVTGTNSLQNEIAGVTIDDGSSSNLIGGLVPSARNVISGNIGYADYGVIVANAGTTANVVEGNYIGMGADGVTRVPDFFGVICSDGATNNIFGGTVAGARNVISGNSSYGMMVVDPGTTGNVVEGNYVGLDATGTNVAPDYFGVIVFGGATNNLVGGITPGAANFISGSQYGVCITDPGTSGNVVQGNFIGTDAFGHDGGVGNFDNVELQNGATGNFIGGTALGEGNVIAFATGTGVILYDPGTTNNSIRGNAIFDNFYLGIDLNGDGPTPNQPPGAAGPNNFQNFPVITNAWGSAGSTVVAGTLTSLPNTSFFIDVYRNLSPDYTGYGEGQFYLGSVGVNTDNSGNAGFSLTNTTGNYSGQYLTATATAVSGDTSEFALDVVATNFSAPSAVFAGPFQMSSAGFSFALNLATNFSYHIQAATNLAQQPVAWVNLTNFTAGNPVFNFNDVSATNYPVRFYRVGSP